MSEQYDHCSSLSNNDSCKGELDSFEYIPQCSLGDALGASCDGS